MKTIAVLLAADMGTRMCSDIPKVLHLLAGRPMIEYALDAVHRATGNQPVVVVGHEMESFKEIPSNRAILVGQAPQSGAGHILQQVEKQLRSRTDLVLVMPGDMPLVGENILSELVDKQSSSDSVLTMVILQADRSCGFRRVLRENSGQVFDILNEDVAEPQELVSHEFNTGIYCFQADWLWDNLPRIPLSSGGEYHLTDLIGIAIRDGNKVQSILTRDTRQFIGINTRVDLAAAELLLRQQINVGHMLAGVTLVDPATTYIEPGVRIGKDTVIWPNTHIQGQTEIGEHCELGPDAIIKGTRIGDHCKVFASVLEFALLEDYVQIGPFGHLRKGAHLASGVHMGNFGEVKNSYLAPGVKMGHFSYIGDAQVGSEVNIGAGTITCNFGLDGTKRKTEIGEGAFIGSDTLLVAPVKVGEGAATGSGAVVTKDVPAGYLAVGMPARAIRKR